MSSRRRILVVEDEEDLRQLYRVSLTLAGYDVEEAADGLEALRRLDEAPPDLVVLDLMLPFIGGAAVHQEIASHVLTRDIPVVIITGAVTDLSDLNVACILRKPITPDELVRAVRDCLLSGAKGTV